LGEYTASGALIQETIWMGGIPVATLQPNGSTVAIYYVHTDHLGTPRKITRPSDNGLMWRWDPDTFGSVTPNTNPAGLGAFNFNLRFPGQYSLNESGLYYNYFRTYDPQMGRYIESDPIGLYGGGYSTYAYSGANPISNADPFGLSSLIYNPSTGTITVVNGAGQAIGTFPAGNNTTNPATDPNSAGPYPQGTFPYTGYVNHGSDPNSAYGANGAFRFPHPGCPNCEVHSGRANRGGPKHPTQGCIRTTDSATSLIKQLNQNGDPLTGLTVTSSPVPTNPIPIDPAIPGGPIVYLPDN
jgi:RHS repeat-associated protein